MNDVSGPIPVLRLIVQVSSSVELMKLVTEDEAMVTEFMYVATN